ncbi:LLM class flavin-dependent oxidoreductase [Microlunatus sp. GCM10028923]|uniref:LLM class flavin-dependent oxidoreductase n=1 Tax=Microlunatus sp. GCM10028923 TaxID=3273400 RepID=UPI0036202A2A
MTDYGQHLQFGLIIDPAADHPDRVLAQAELAERSGLDLVSVPDHPYRPAALEAMTVLTAIAARTERIRLFPNVANLPLRPPALLARMIGSLDRISGGRAELALGAGGYRSAVVAEGGPDRTPAESVAALAEAMIMIRALLGEGAARIRWDGEHYRLPSAEPGPRPVHPIELWVGALGPRMLRLIGRYGDGWLPSSTRVPPTELAGRQAIIDAAAVEHGRDPAAIRRLYNLQPGVFPVGPPASWPEQLIRLAITEGISTFLLPTGSAALITTFGTETAPAVRAGVQRHRHGAAVAR